MAVCCNNVDLLQIAAQTVSKLMPEAGDLSPRPHRPCVWSIAGLIVDLDAFSGALFIHI